MKKKLLFVNGHLNVGGVENSLINVLKSIDYNHFEVDLILFEELGDYANELPKEVSVIFYDFSKVYGPVKQCIADNIKNKNWWALSLRSVFMLEKVIGLNALFLAKPLFKVDKIYDCAVAYREGICTEFIGYVIKSKNKVTWWHHGTFDYTEKQTKRLIKVYKRFNKIIAVSNGCKEMLTTKIHGINNKLATIPNIINVNEIRKKANDEPSFKINDSDYITLLSVGRLSPEKGMVNCVHACKKLVDNGYKINWYLIGEGLQRGEIEQLIKYYNLESNMFLLGAISNPYPYIKKAFIYVHPSLVESLSISVLEALSLNKPVAVATSMGPMEFIRNKENGLLVEPTPEGLYKGVVSLIRDRNLYSHLENDNSDVLKNYSPNVIMQKIYELIEVS